MKQLEWKITSIASCNLEVICRQDMLAFNSKMQMQGLINTSSKSIFHTGPISFNLSALNAIFQEHFKQTEHTGSDNYKSKKLTDLRLLLSFRRSSATTSKSEDTEVRSGMVGALGMVAVGTSIAARSAQYTQTQHE